MSASDPHDEEFPATWAGGHALVVEFGDCEFHGRCQCGVPLGSGRPDEPLDKLGLPWERHVMTRNSARDEKSCHGGHNGDEAQAEPGALPPLAGVVLRAAQDRAEAAETRATAAEAELTRLRGQLGSPDLVSAACDAEQALADALDRATAAEAKLRTSTADVERISRLMWRAETERDAARAQAAAARALAAGWICTVGNGKRDDATIECGEELLDALDSAGDPPAAPHRSRSGVVWPFGGDRG